MNTYTHTNSNTALDCKSLATLEVERGEKKKKNNLQKVLLLPSKTAEYIYTFYLNYIIYSTFL